MTHLDRVNWEPANPPNRAGITGIPDMAWRVLPQESVKAVQGYRMGNPDQVLFSDAEVGNLCCRLTT